MAKKREEQLTGTEKEFIDIFRNSCGKLNAWEAWPYIISAIACSLANVADPDSNRVAKREEEYQRCIDKLGGVEVPAKALAVITMALDNNPDQDFLGKMFMQLELGSHWHGQFFTPYDVAFAMAQMNINDGRAASLIEDKGWISVNDPACGAGATLIAAVGAFRQQGINYQQHVCFTANDIDRTATQMCFIQLSLLGCAGYVAVTDTLSNPITGSVLFPEEKDGQEFWYMPMWWNETWTYRRLFHAMGKMTAKAKGNTKGSETKEYRQMSLFDADFKGGAIQDGKWRIEKSGR